VTSGESAPKTGRGRAAGAHAVGRTFLRIHFSEEDLGRTRAYATPDLALEAVLSLSVLWAHSGPSYFDAWRRHVKDSLFRPASSADESSRNRDYLARILESVAGLVTLRPRAGIANAALDEELSASPAPAPGADGSPDETILLAFPDELASPLRAYARIAIGPFWPHILASVRNDLAARARLALHGGAERLLSTLGPDVQWETPTLRIPCCTAGELRLRGQGLILVPTYFGWQAPLFMSDGADVPVLAYPILRDMAPGKMNGGRGSRSHADRSLTALLGRGRAKVLRSVREGCNTSELSRRAGVSLSTASEHAAVLREAGLITSSRDRSGMTHSLTSLGAALLTRHL
jgi:hypothetical protein